MAIYEVGDAIWREFGPQEKATMSVSPRVFRKLSGGGRIFREPASRGVTESSIAIGEVTVTTSERSSYMAWADIGSEPMIAIPLATYDELRQRKSEP